MLLALDIILFLAGVGVGCCLTLIPVLWIVHRNDPEHHKWPGGMSPAVQEILAIVDKGNFSVAEIQAKMRELPTQEENLRILDELGLRLNRMEHNERRTK